MSTLASGVSAAQRRYAMAILAIVYMFNFVDRQILAILLPAIRDEFGSSDAFLGFLSGTAFALFYVTLGVPIAQYADKHNRRNLIAAAVALWSAMTAVSGLAQNIWHLALARVGVGVGEAGCSPPAHSMIADYYPPEQRSTAMGFYTLGISAGIMLAYLAGGWVVEEPRLARGVFHRRACRVSFLRWWFGLRSSSRGADASEGTVAAGAESPRLLRVVCRFLIRRKSFVHMAVAAGLSSFVGYSVISFLPSFMVRSFEMDLATLGRLAGSDHWYRGRCRVLFRRSTLPIRLGRATQRAALKFIWPHGARFGGSCSCSCILSNSWQAGALAVRHSGRHE